MVSRAQAQTAHLVGLLQALPEEQLHAVLDGLGVAPERRPEGYQDTRRCQTCGWGYVRHRAYEQDPTDGHPWNPGGTQ